MYKQWRILNSPLIFIIHQFGNTHVYKHAEMCVHTNTTYTNKIYTYKHTHTWCIPTYVHTVYTHTHTYKMCHGSVMLHDCTSICSPLYSKYHFTKQVVFNHFAMLQAHHIMYKNITSLHAYRNRIDVVFPNCYTQ